jgi:hypothetical protein
MAFSTAVLNYTHHSPFKHLVPPVSDLWQNPTQFFGTWINVIRLHEADRNARVIASREQKLDDLAKKRHFQAAHGLDKQNAVKNFLSSKEESAEVSGDPQPVAMVAAETTESPQPGPQPAQNQKKWFGVF